MRGDESSDPEVQVAEPLSHVAGTWCIFSISDCIWNEWNSDGNLASLVIAMLSTLKKSLLGNIHGRVLKSGAITKHNAAEVQALCYLKFLHQHKQ